MHLAIFRKKERAKKNSSIHTAQQPSHHPHTDPQTMPEKFSHHCNKISSINPKQKTSNKISAINPKQKKSATIKIQR